MVITYEINRCKQEQSLAEVQKTITIYDFALVSKLQPVSWYAMESKRGVLLSTHVRPAMRNNGNNQNN